jgi:hypothetical protein
MSLEDTGQDFRDLEHRLIAQPRDAGAKFIQAGGHLDHGLVKVTEAWQDQAGVVLAYPLRVVALLRHRP